MQLVLLWVDDPADGYSETHYTLLGVFTSDEEAAKAFETWGSRRSGGGDYRHYTDTITVNQLRSY